jgi:hypothetical protein
MRSYLKNTQHKAELADGSSGRVQIPVPPKTKKNPNNNNKNQTLCNINDMI